MVGLSAFAGACQATSVTPSVVAISISSMPSRPACAGAVRAGSGKYMNRRFPKKATTQNTPETPKNPKKNFTNSPPSQKQTPPPLNTKPQTINAKKRQKKKDDGPRD